MTPEELFVDLDGGGRARVMQTDGDRVTLSSDRAFPPGADLEGSSAIGRLRVKVRGSKRQGDEFRVEGRFVNLSRAQRAALG